MTSVAANAPEQDKVCEVAIKSSSRRDVGLDVLRGIAVTVMVGANMAPYLLPHDYPFWFRVWASVAAPLFVALSGFIGGLASAHRTRPLSHTLKRAVALLAMAALVDWACWGIVPFNNFDVLYLLALLQIAAHALSKLHPFATLGSSLLILFVAAELRQAFGYGQIHGHWFADRAQSWLLDGWFPVFPWLGLGLLGMYIGRRGRMLDGDVERRRFGLTGGLLMGSAAISWWHWPPPAAIRGGYAELFYPPSGTFLVAVLGFLSLTAATVSYLRRGHPNGPMALLGRRALLAYVIHLVLIGRLIRPFHGAGTWARFALYYLVVLTVLWGIAWGTTKLWPRPRSFVGRLLLG